jgi:trk system potassium uptake protein TrkA
MGKEKQKVFAVIGLGTFGVRLCEELGTKGGKVLAIDNQEKLIEKVKDFVSQSILMDSTDEDAMSQVPFEDVDTAVVAIGDNLEASIITTAILKKIGIPRILARSVTDIHRRILDKSGPTKSSTSKSTRAPVSGDS